VIVVDTSVWVAALRSAGSREARVLAALLDADEALLAVPVRTELIGGARTADRARLRKLLTALPLAYPTDDTWSTMDHWSARARDEGEKFGVGDLLIAALAREAGALVWSLDTDFDRMARLGLIDLYSA
jgi:predicted nucleic acid-binding protein